MSQLSLQEPPRSHLPATGSREYRQCSVCVLDTNDDPNMRFDEQGRSHYYHEYVRAEQRHVRTGDAGKRELGRLVERLKRDGHNRKYDCVTGVSGGVDSTYLVYLTRQLGLRPLAVHFDNGWNSELAVKNIENVVGRLGVDLYTYVVDWTEFRDLQLAYLRSSVVDIEVVSDHAIIATMWRLAAENGVQHILTGNNVVTESVMPPHWNYNKTDHVNLRAIHREFGTTPLKSYPIVDWRVKRYMHGVRGIRTHDPLNLVPYNKVEIKNAIVRELGWRDYGGKHYESIFTRFYQGYILPTKFGIDKRKAHLSNLIFSGQITKSDALAELETPIYPPDLLRQDMEFVLKKLELNATEFDAIMKQPPRAHADFEVERSFYDAYRLFKPLRGAVAGVRRLLSHS